MPAHAIVQSKNKSRKLKISFGSAFASLLLKSDPPAIIIVMRCSVDGSNDIKGKRR